ncbi:MAG: 30S ribosomal protein S2 [Candidatus Magasanikbacteria bacterium GW2011_GWA2_37_8]|uniref:Small ribosomal subunit protein uS2 n=1 Tax=Candidatus Magasanikbacteria bacterium GW2011_GWA2_37_8 TaxID=1619036 RepID=A0A0G0HF34_9BACT|nr:MAG: 30S ribosomal protein S2 [Candidatus Magasanikbacteria bacterium GW2011_GWA2_37_8]
MTELPTLMEMLKAGVHFGHQNSRWHPKMQPYLFGLRNGVHIINLESTQEQLAKALEYVKTLSSKGKVILFVGIKRQAQPVIKAAAESCGMPYSTERWIGGLLTNFSEVKQRLKKYNTLKQEVASGEVEKYTKKEQLDIKKDIANMDRYLGGLANIDRLPDAMFVADMRISKTAVAEAERMGVPIVGVCDSNVNPEKADYVIPANDDAVNSIKLIADLLAEAVNEGKAIWEKNKLAIDKEVKKAAVARPEISEEKMAGKSSLVKAVAKKAAPKTAERRPMKVSESI